VSSFETPINPIGVSPLVGPLVQVQFNYKWCSVIVGSLTQLLQQTTWEVADQAALTAIQEDVFDLMAAFCVNPPAAGTTPNTGSDTGDDFMLRQSPDNPCELQTSVDGITWCTWADISKCVPQVTQPGTGSTQPKPGTCASYHAILDASGAWLLPVPVSTGDVINVTNAMGAWNDGTLNPWQCPDGNNYFAGLCVGGSTLAGGDPIPTSPHMSLIAHVVGGIYFPVLGGSVTIPGGIAFGQLEFIANDSIRSDNLGSINFDVEVCNNEPGSWTHTFDFKLSDGGFAPVLSASPGPSGIWTAGVGWTPGDCVIGGLNTRLVDVFRTHASRHITSMFMTFDYTAGTFDSALIREKLESTSVEYYNSPAGTPSNGANQTRGSFADDAADLQDNITIETCQTSGAFDGATTLTKLVITGVGTDPF
jgi:hypothetical protein